MASISTLPVFDFRRNIKAATTNISVAKIIIKAEGVTWAPISFGGRLHDRASYRYFWQTLERAHQTGQALPSEVRAYFAATSH